MYKWILSFSLYFAVDERKKNKRNRPCAKDFESRVSTTCKKRGDRSIHLGDEARRRVLSKIALNLRDILRVL